MREAPPPAIYVPCALCRVTRLVACGTCGVLAVVSLGRHLRIRALVAPCVELDRPRHEHMVHRCGASCISVLSVSSASDQCKSPGQTCHVQVKCSTSGSNVPQHVVFCIYNYYKESRKWPDYGVAPGCRHCCCTSWPVDHRCHVIRFASRASASRPAALSM